MLLAGCGRGDHVAHFQERGATVTGVDASEAAVATARERHPDAAFAVVDLADGLPFASDAFDVVVSNLVLSHVPDWAPVLDAFERVLRPGGTLVVSTIHPQYRREKWGLDRYDERAERVVNWGVAELPTSYRPTSTMLQSVIDAGFSLETVAEPTPESAYESENPERYAAAMAAPQVLVLCANTEE